MKRSIKLAVAAAVALTATSAFATNGDNLIGVGAKARGMGGVGIGMSHGAESGLANPAMIATVKGTEVSFGGTVFMPDVATNTGAGMSAGFLDSKADLSVIPEVAVAQKVSDNITWGIGMYGTAGMGTDYRDRTTTTGNFNMVTNLQLMQFSLPVAYSNSGVTVAIAPIIQYGALDIQYKTSGGTYGTGVGQDLSMGYTLGGAYETSGVTLGVVYKSAIDMTYDKVLSTAGSGFGLSLTDNLEQPSEYGAGISYKMGQNTFALDYKRVNWASAKGYKTFGWEDQNVYAIGYEYNTGAWAARLGYNRASSPITEQGSANNGHIYNVMNLLGFPAIVETHYTVGGTYGVTKNTSLDVAYVYVPETEETFAATGAGLASTVSTKHSQKAISAQVNFNF